MYFVFVSTYRRKTHPQPNHSRLIMVLCACQIEFMIIHVKKISFCDINIKNEG